MGPIVSATSHALLTGAVFISSTFSNLTGQPSVVTPSPTPLTAEPMSPAWDGSRDGDRMNVLFGQHSTRITKPFRRAVEMIVGRSQVPRVHLAFIEPTRVETRGDEDRVVARGTPPVLNLGGANREVRIDIV